MKAEKISHIGIAVPDLEKAIREYQSILGVNSVEKVGLVGSEKVNVAMIQIGDSEIELLSPTSEDSAVAKFLRERGPGIHHIAIKVPSVAKAIEDAKAKGFRVIDSVPRAAARGAEAAFVHPKSLDGVLLEFYST